MRALSAAAAPRALRVVTWNVHGFVGTDRRRDVERVAAALRRLDPDIVGLQEVDCRTPLRDGRSALDLLAARTGLRATPGPVREEHQGFFGNALLTRWPVSDVTRLDVSVRGREPRGILSAETHVGPHRLRVVVTHFGLRAAERRSQLGALLELIAESADEPLVLMGDFNEWRPRAWTLSRLHAALGAAPRVPSFPSRLPLLALDRIWVQPHAALLAVDACSDEPARSASDHLPVHALVDLGGPRAAFNSRWEAAPALAPASAPGRRRGG